MVLHLVLGIRKDDIRQVPYGRILAFNRTGTRILAQAENRTLEYDTSLKKLEDISDYAKRVAFLEKMDKGEIALSVGVELSYLDESSQREVLEQCAINDCTPSYSQAWRMHKADREGTLTTAAIQTIMSEEKANQKARLKIPMERIRKYFPQGYTAAQIEDAVVKLCERDYRRRTDRER